MAIARKSPLDAFFESVQKEKVTASEVADRARRLTDSIASAFPDAINRAVARINPSLARYRLRYMQAFTVQRWHYPLRITARDAEARNFSVELHDDGDGVIAQVYFAVLAPDVVRGDHCVTILTLLDLGYGNPATRHFADVRDVNAMCWIVEGELVNCASGELRERMRAEG